MLTNRYKSAMQFAATVHDGHLRKGNEVACLRGSRQGAR